MTTSKSDGLRQIPMVLNNKNLDGLKIKSVITYEVLLLTGISKHSICKQNHDQSFILYITKKKKFLILLITSWLNWVDN